MNRFKSEQEAVFNAEHRSKLVLKIKNAISEVARERGNSKLFDGFDEEHLSAGDLRIAERVFSGSINAQTDEDFLAWRREFEKGIAQVDRSGRFSREILADALGSYLARNHFDSKAA